MRTEEILSRGIVFGEVYNNTPNKLPWYRHPEKIPADEKALAERVAQRLSDDDSEYEWRMRNYEAWRIGWSFAVRCYYPWFMLTHEEALGRMAGLCDHKWGDKTDAGEKNNVLGTYDLGYNHTCTKCGKTEYVRTAYNNWSGD